MRLAVITLAAGCGFSATVPGGAPTDAPDGVTSDAPDANPQPGDRDGDGVGDATDLCPDAYDPMQRDHDGDLRGDACDRCPHANSATDPDDDGDGVGDACDPRPGTAGESRVLWIGFYDEDAATVAAWTPRAGTWSVSGGRLRATSANNLDYITAIANVPRAHVETSISTANLGSSGDAAGVLLGHQGALPSSFTQTYQCVIGIGSSNSRVVELMSTWSGQNPIEDEDSWGGNFPANVDMVASLDSDMRCTASGMGTTITSNTNRGPTDGAMVVVVGRTQATFDYLFVVDRD